MVEYFTAFNPVGNEHRYFITKNFSLRAICKLFYVVHIDGVYYYADPLKGCVIFETSDKQVAYQEMTNCAPLGYFREGSLEFHPAKIVGVPFTFCPELQRLIKAANQNVDKMSQAITPADVLEKLIRALKEME